MLDNVELIMYMKFQKILMTGCRDLDKKHKKCPQNGFFPQLVTPKIFFQKSGSVTSLHLWYFTFMQNFRKILKAILRKIVKDGLTWAITKDPVR